MGAHYPNFTDIIILQLVPYWGELHWLTILPALGKVIHDFPTFTLISKVATSKVAMTLRGKLTIIL